MNETVSERVSICVILCVYVLSAAHDLQTSLCTASRCGQRGLFVLRDHDGVVAPVAHTRIFLTDTDLNSWYRALSFSGATSRPWHSTITLCVQQSKYEIIPLSYNINFPSSDCSVFPVLLPAIFENTGHIVVTIPHNSIIILCFTRRIETRKGWGRLTFIYSMYPKLIELALNNLIILY